MTQKTLFRWHLWLGLITGLGLFLVGLTGAIAVFAEEIDWLVHPALRAKPAPDGRRADADTLLAHLRTAHPAARVAALHLSARPAFAHTANLELREPGRPSRTLIVFLDPATGGIQGELIQGAGYTASVYQFIRQSHVRLLMGFWGRVFVGVLGVTLLLSCVTGLWIYRGWFKKLFRLNLRGGWRQRPAWAELHKLVGGWSLLFNLLIALTGAVLGLENLSNKLRQTWLAPAAPPAKVAALPPVASPARPPPGANALLATARAAFPDLTVRTLTFSARPDGPVVLRGGVPNPFVADSHVRSASSVTLDGATGAVLRVTDGRRLDFWRRVYWTFDPLHFGYFGGLLTKLIWFVLGLTPGLLAVSGTWMWWRRRPPATRPAAAAPVAAFLSRWLPPAMLFATLGVAYAVVARRLGGWGFSPLLAEHWLVKPVSLAVVAFPITGLLGWLLWRTRHLALQHALVCLCGGAWYVLLTSLFPPAAGN